MAFVRLAPQVGAAIAHGQRQEVGICSECGGFNGPKLCAEKSCPCRELPKLQRISAGRSGPGNRGRRQSACIRVSERREDGLRG